MTTRKKQSKRTPMKSENVPSRSVAGKSQPTTRSVGIDSRNESTKRYGGLEPEGYTRHVHGNREGEFQSGGKSSAELPIEQGAPMKERRYRKGSDTREIPPGQYGGKTFDSMPGDRDIVGSGRKKPRTRSK